MLNYQPGEAFDREAHVVLRERAERTSYEAVVSITAGEVRLWRELPRDSVLPFNQPGSHVMRRAQPSTATTRTE